MLFRSIPDSPFELPTAFASRIKTAIIFDHIDNEVFIVSEDTEKFNSICKDIEGDFNEMNNVKDNSIGSIELINKGSEEEHQCQV